MNKSILRIVLAVIAAALGVWILLLADGTKVVVLGGVAIIALAAAILAP